jgi:Uma2 family endonuclease
MLMPHAARVWTRENVLALPDDGKRYELIDGELLVSPSPSWTHQLAVGGLHVRLWPYVRSYAIGTVLTAPADLDLRSGQLSQPDLFVLAADLEGRRLREWEDAGIPILAVEVLRIVKRSRYQRSGIAEFWIVDVDARLIERWRPDDSRPEVLAETIEWQPAGATEALVIELAEYFREVWSEG